MTSDRPPGAPDSSWSAAAVAAQRGRRLWRMRKLHQTADAELWPQEAGAVELRYTLNGTLTYRRTWTTWDDAVREAVARRAELERDGWSFHW